MASLNFCDCCKKETGRNYQPQTDFAIRTLNKRYHLCEECKMKVTAYIEVMKEENKFDEGGYFAPLEEPKPEPEDPDGEPNE